MKKCRKVVEKCEETQEEFWVRKILWAISIIEEKRMALTWNHLNKVTHISKPNFHAHEEYFREKLGGKIVDQICPN